MSCCVITSTGTVKIVETCSKFDRVAKPGCQCLIPCYNVVAGTISMRLQQMDVACETKTKDNVFLTLRVSIQYQVINETAKIKDAHYRLTNPHAQMTSYVYDVVRSSVPKIDLDDVFLTKEEIAAQIQESLKASMASFGYEIL